MAQSKNTVDNTALGTQTTREGGREAAKPLSPESFAATSRSGAASTAASLLNLRQRLMLLEESLLDMLEDPAMQSDRNIDNAQRIRRLRQTGFRVDRRG